MTLSQILDVYLTLSRNQQTKSVDPLYCHLSSRISLASQYAYLLSSSEQGKTFAEIAAEHIHSHESSSVDGEEVDDFVESYGKNHEDLGQDERADDGDLLPQNADIEDTNLEAAEVKLDYHAREGRMKEDVNPHDGQSDSNPLDSKPENDDPDVTGNAENETSATSTVRGDELESQGEYSPFPDICYAHCLFDCLDCNANIYADLETSYDHVAGSANAASISGSHSEDIGELVTSNDDAGDDEELKAEIQSAVGDTESSRTVEAGDDTFEQPLNAEAEAKRETFIEIPEDFHDYVDARAPADNADAQDQVNADSVQAGDLYRHNQDFLSAPQSIDDLERAAATPSATSEFDHDDLVDFHGEYEGHSSSERATSLDLANGAAGNEAFLQADGHEELFEARTPDGPAHDAESEHDAVYDVVDEDDLFLGDDETKASVQEATPPSTPSNSKTSKRKTRDEEDDFDLLDSGTPDFKRRRPS